jgi:lysine 2,3-aminomutase
MTDEQKIKNLENINRDNPSWNNWIWQQKNAIKDVRDLKEYFPNVDSKLFEKLYEYSGERIRFQITPYVLSQIPKEISHKDFVRNPWFKQFFPRGKIYTQGHDAYNGTDNWEKPEEFPTSNLHYKYTNRVLVRFRDCLGYCSFCFEALGTLEKKPVENKRFGFEDWEKSLKYIEDHPEIEEVILSGGEPLLNSDSKLERILREISNIKDKNGKPKIRFKRIHTRAFTINPYRITPDLIQTIKDHRVNEIALDVAHPSEFTPEFEDAIWKIREGTGRYAPLFVLHTPLFRGINDNTETLWELFSKSYEMNIKPYYLLHSMPHTLFADKERVSVRDGIKLIKPLWRTKSHIAIPEYIIVHYDGKKTIPLELGGTPEFQYLQDKEGNPVVRFKNWRGNWVEYPDIEDTIK